MPAQTPSGLPYPTPAEAVRDGAAAIQNLAAGVDKRIQGGTAVVTSSVNGDGYIDYPAAFRPGTVPGVVITLADPTNTPILVFSYFAYTDNTRAAFKMLRADGSVPGVGAYRFAWTAVGLI